MVVFVGFLGCNLIWTVINNDFVKIMFINCQFSLSTLKAAFDIQGVQSILSKWLLIFKWPPRPLQSVAMMDDVETVIDVESQENDFSEPTPSPTLGFHLITAEAPSYKDFSPSMWKPTLCGEKRVLPERLAEPVTPTRTEGRPTYTENSLPSNLMVYIIWNSLRSKNSYIA